jgi:ribosome biogenesis protein SSF1/2
VLCILYVTTTPSVTHFAQSASPHFYMPRFGTQRKKRRTHAEPKQEQEGVPRSLVFRQGSVARPVAQLVIDLRRVLEPFTASRLRESSRNRLKDFLSVSGPLGVSHLIAVRQQDLGPTLRIMRAPHGPTLSFRVQEYALAQDVRNAQRRPQAPGTSGEYLHAPLVVLNGFSGQEAHKQILASTLQHVFPSIDVNSVALKDCRRVALFNLREVDGEFVVDLRHYLINASPVGITKTVKKIVKGKIPDLSKYNDMEEFVLNGQEALSSDSEAEDVPQNRVVLSQNFAGRGNRKSQTSSIRLKEIGPRITLQLLKIEEGMCGGRVLFHHRISKTADELSHQEEKVGKQQALKLLRKETQEENVNAKKRRNDAVVSDDDDMIFEDEAVDSDSY